MNKLVLIGGGAAAGLLGLVALAARGSKLLPRGRRPGAAVVIGDSIAAHGGFVGVIGRVPGMVVENAGIVGNSTGQMLARAEGLIRPGLVDVIVEGDLNDGARRSSYTISNLRRIYQLARSAGARVIAVTSTPWRGYTRWSPEAQARQDEVRRWVLGGADGLVDVAIDVYTPLQDPARPGYLNPAYATQDRLHLNRAGQERLGQLIVERAYA